jgi:GAF domain-containing protein
LPERSSIPASGKEYRPGEDQDHAPVNDSLIGQVVRTKRPFRSTSSQGQTLKVSTGFMVYSLLHVPLISKDKVLGVLSVDNRLRRQEFTGSDENLLTLIGRLCRSRHRERQLYEQAQQEIACGCRPNKRCETANSATSWL